MKSLRFLDRRAGYSLASLGLLLGVVAPAVLPAFTSADVITSRSITMSSATKDASDTIEVKGTTSATGALPAGGGLIIIFCDNTPLIGATCNAPAGMSVSSPSAGGSTAGTASSSAANEIKWVATGAIGNSTPFDFTVSGITNPSAVGTFYARMASYNDTNITTATDDKSTGVIDTGAVALSTSDEIGVNAYVLESMTFCVSKGDVGNTGDPIANNAGHTAVAAPTKNCGTTATGGCVTYHTGCLIAPDMQLGQLNGTAIALDTANVSTGGVYAQLSTNAANGVSVHLKSGATTCAGLYLNGVDDSTHCNIPAHNVSGNGITAGTAGFGVTVGSASGAKNGDGTGGGGTDITVTPGTGYDATHAYLSDNGTTGDIGAYGTEIIKSTGIVDNMNVPVTFNATIGSTTPAGAYGAKFSMIATGSF